MWKFTPPVKWQMVFLVKNVTKASLTLAQFWSRTGCIVARQRVSLGVYIFKMASSDTQGHKIVASCALATALGMKILSCQMSWHALDTKPHKAPITLSRLAPSLACISACLSCHLCHACVRLALDKSCQNIFHPQCKITTYRGVYIHLWGKIGK